MRVLGRCVIVLGLLTVMVTATWAAPFRPSGRQAYGPWQQSASNSNAYFRVYYYKVKASDTTYQKQRVYYYKNAPEWVYWYNPTSGKFWARCPSKKNQNATYKQRALDRTETWSVLKPRDRSKDLDDCINDFPDPDIDNMPFCPSIPDCSDGELMVMPTPELPD